MALCFTLTTVAWSAPTLPSAPPSASIAQTISIPESLGSVHERYVATSEVPVIIHIQDAHAHEEVQANTQSILEHLKGEYGVDLLFLEGGLGTLDPDHIRFFEDTQKNRRFADLLLKEGVLSGAENFLVEERLSHTTKETQAFGVEDIEVYRTNLLAYRNVIGKLNESNAFHRDYQSQYLSHASKIFNQDLKTFFRQWMMFQENHDHLQTFLKTLSVFAVDHLNLALTNPRNQIQWPELLRYFKLGELEGDLDFERANEEHQALLAWLAEQDIQENLKDGIEQLFEASEIEGYLDLRDFVEKFYQVVAPHGFQFESYPAFSRLLGIHILKNELHAERLYQELERLTDQILEKLAQSDEEKRMIQLYQDFLLLHKLLRLELSHADYGRVLDREQKIIPSQIELRLNQVTAEKPSTAWMTLDAVFGDALKFYQAAKQRERVIFESMMARLKKAKHKNAVLITGGFHAEGLQTLIQDKKLSYIQITPRISEIGDSQNYQDILMLRKDTTTLRSSMKHLGPLSGLKAISRAESRTSSHYQALYNILIETINRSEARMTKGEDSITDEESALLADLVGRNLTERKTAMLMLQRPQHARPIIAERLTELLNSRNVHAKRGAINVLGHMPSEAKVIVPKLGKIARNQREDQTVRNAAGMSLIRLSLSSMKAYRLVRRAIHSRRGEDSKFILPQITRRFAHRFLDDLIQDLYDPDKRVKAVDALIKIGKKNAPETIARLQKARQHEISELGGVNKNFLTAVKHVLEQIESDPKPRKHQRSEARATAEEWKAKVYKAVDSTKRFDQIWDWLTDDTTLLIRWLAKQATPADLIQFMQSLEVMVNTPDMMRYLGNIQMSQGSALVVLRAVMRGIYKKYQWPDDAYPQDETPLSEKYKPLKDANVEMIRFIWKHLATGTGLDPGAILKMTNSMEAMPRHLFAPAYFEDLSVKEHIYTNNTQGIGEAQTLSEPLLVAKALAVLELQGNEKVLEVGAGRGWTAALLSELVPNGSVHATEIRPSLIKAAHKTTQKLGISNLKLIQTDRNHLGYPKAGPYNVIMVWADSGQTQVHPDLLAQLAEGGKIIIPITKKGESEVKLKMFVKKGDALNEIANLGAVNFVPLALPQTIEELVIEPMIEKALQGEMEPEEFDALIDGAAADFKPFTPSRKAALIRYAGLEDDAKIEELNPVAGKLIKQITQVARADKIKILKQTYKERYEKNAESQISDIIEDWGVEVDQEGAWNTFKNIIATLAGREDKGLLPPDLAGEVSQDAVEGTAKGSRIDVETATKIMEEDYDFDAARKVWVQRSEARVTDEAQEDKDAKQIRHFIETKTVRKRLQYLIESSQSHDFSDLQDQTKNFQGAGRRNRSAPKKQFAVEPLFKKNLVGRYLLITSDPHTLDGEFILFQARKIDERGEKSDRITYLVGQRATVNQTDQRIQFSEPYEIALHRTVGGQKPLKALAESSLVFVVKPNKKSNSRSESRMHVVRSLDEGGSFLIDYRTLVVVRSIDPEDHADRHVKLGIYNPDDVRVWLPDLETRVKSRGGNLTIIDRSISPSTTSAGKKSQIRVALNNSDALLTVTKSDYAHAFAIHVDTDKGRNDGIRVHHTDRVLLTTLEHLRPVEFMKTDEGDYLFDQIVKLNSGEILQRRVKMREMQDHYQVKIEGLPPFKLNYENLNGQKIAAVIDRLKQTAELAPKGAAQWDYPALPDEKLLEYMAGDDKGIQKRAYDVLARRYRAHPNTFYAKHLTGLLSDPEPYTRVLAAKLLSYFGEHAAPAIPKLLELFGDNSDYGVKVAVAGALSRLSQVSAETTQFVEQKILKSRNGRLRRAAVKKIPDGVIAKASILNEFYRISLQESRRDDRLLAIERLDKAPFKRNYLRYLMITAAKSEDDLEKQRIEEALEILGAHVDQVKDKRKTRSESRAVISFPDEQPKFLTTKLLRNQHRIEIFDLLMKGVLERSNIKRVLSDDVEIVITIPYHKEPVEDTQKIVTNLRDVLPDLMEAFEVPEERRKAAILVIGEHNDAEEIRRLNSLTKKSNDHVQIMPFIKPTTENEQPFTGKPWTVRAGMLAAAKAGANFVTIDADVGFSESQTSAASLLESLLFSLYSSGDAKMVELNPPRDFYYDDGIVHLFTYLFNYGVYGIDLKQFYGGEFSIERSHLPTLLALPDLVLDETYCLECQLLTRTALMVPGQPIVEHDMLGKTHKTIVPEKILGDRRINKKSRKTAPVPRLNFVLEKAFDDAIRDHYAGQVVQMESVRHDERTKRQSKDPRDGPMEHRFPDDYRKELFKRFKDPDPDAIRSFPNSAMLIQKILGSDDDGQVLFAALDDLIQTSKVEDFHWSTDQWAQATARFLAYYARTESEDERTQVLNAYHPVLFAGTLHFGNEVREMTYAEAFQHVDQHYLLPFQAALKPFKIPRSETRAVTIEPIHLDISLANRALAIPRDGDMFQAVLNLYNTQRLTGHLDKQGQPESFFRYIDNGGDLIQYGVFFPGQEEPVIYKENVPDEVLQRAEMVIIENNKRITRPGAALTKQSRMRLDDPVRQYLVPEVMAREFPDEMWLSWRQTPSGNPWRYVFNPFAIWAPRQGIPAEDQPLHMTLSREDGFVHHTEMDQFENIRDLIAAAVEMNQSARIQGKRLFRFNINGWYYSEADDAPKAGSTQGQAHAHVTRFILPIENQKLNKERELYDGRIQVSSLASKYQRASVFETDLTGFLAVNVLADLVTQAVQAITKKGNSFNVIVAPGRGEDPTKLTVYVIERSRSSAEPFPNEMGFAENGRAFVAGPGQIQKSFRQDARNVLNQVTGSQESVEKIIRNLTPSDTATNVRHLNLRYHPQSQRIHLYRGDRSVATLSIAKGTARLFQDARKVLHHRSIRHIYKAQPGFMSLRLDDGSVLILHAAGVWYRKNNQDVHMGDSTTFEIPDVILQQLIETGESIDLDGHIRSEVRTKDDAQEKSAEDEAFKAHYESALKLIRDNAAALNQREMPESGRLLKRAYSILPTMRLVKMGAKQETMGLDADISKRTIYVPGPERSEYPVERIARILVRNALVFIDFEKNPERKLDNTEDKRRFHNQMALKADDAIKDTMVDGEPFMLAFEVMIEEQFIQNILSWLEPSLEEKEEWDRLKELQAAAGQAQYDAEIRAGTRQPPLDEGLRVFLALLRDDYLQHKKYEKLGDSWVDFSLELNEIFRQKENREEDLVTFTANIINIYGAVMRVAKGLQKQDMRLLVDLKLVNGSLVPVLVDALTQYALSRYWSDEDIFEIQETLAIAVENIDPQMQLYTYLRHDDILIEVADAIREADISPEAAERAVTDKFGKKATPLGIAMGATVGLISHAQTKTGGQRLLTAGPAVQALLGAPQGSVLRIGTSLTSSEDDAPTEVSAPEDAATAAAAILDPTPEKPLELLLDAYDYSLPQDAGYQVGIDSLTENMIGRLRGANDIEEFTENFPSDWNANLNLAVGRRGEDASVESLEETMNLILMMLTLYRRKQSRSGIGSLWNLIPGVSNFTRPIEDQWKSFSKRAGGQLSRRSIAEHDRREKVARRAARPQDHVDYEFDQNSAVYFMVLTLFANIENMQKREKRQASLADEKFPSRQLKTYDAALSELSKQRNNPLFEKIRLLLIVFIDEAHKARRAAQEKEERLKRERGASEQKSAAQAAARERFAQYEPPQPPEPPAEKPVVTPSDEPVSVDEAKEPEKPKNVFRRKLKAKQAAEKKAAEYPKGTSLRDFLERVTILGPETLDIVRSQKADTVRRQIRILLSGSEDPKDLDKAYRALQLQLHPDKAGEAYQYLEPAQKSIATLHSILGGRAKISRADLIEHTKTVIEAVEAALPRLPKEMLTKKPAEVTPTATIPAEFQEALERVEAKVDRALLEIQRLWNAFLGKVTESQEEPKEDKRFNTVQQISHQLTAIDILQASTRELTEKIKALESHGRFEEARARSVSIHVIDGLDQDWETLNKLEEVAETLRQLKRKVEHAQDEEAYAAIADEITATLDEAEKRIGAAQKIYESLKSDYFEPISNFLASLETQKPSAAMSSRVSVKDLGAWQLHHSMTINDLVNEQGEATVFVMKYRSSTVESHVPGQVMFAHHGKDTAETLAVAKNYSEMVDDELVEAFSKEDRNIIRTGQAVAHVIQNPFGGEGHLEIVKVRLHTEKGGVIGVLVGFLRTDRSISKNVESISESLNSAVFKKLASYVRSESRNIAPQALEIVDTPDLKYIDTQNSIIQEVRLKFYSEIQPPNVQVVDFFISSDSILALHNNSIEGTALKYRVSYRRHPGTEDSINGGDVYLTFTRQDDRIQLAEVDFRDFNESLPGDKFDIIAASFKRWLISQIDKEFNGRAQMPVKARSAVPAETTRPLTPSSSASRDVEKGNQLSRRAHQLLKDGKPVEAEREARAAVEANSENAFAWTAFVNALLIQRKSSEAVEVSREAATKFPEDAVVHSILAKALSQDQQRAEALEVSREAAIKFPKNVVVQTSFANNLLRAGQSAEALKVIRRVVAKFPNDEWARKTLSRIEQSVSKEGEAGSAGSRDIQRGRELSHKANNLLKQDKFVEAEREARAAIEADSENSFGWVALANALSRQQRHSEAVEAARESASKFPDNVAVLTNFATILLRDGQNAEALKIILAVVKRFPDDERAGQTLVRIKRKVSEEKVTRSAASTALPKPPASPAPQPKKPATPPVSERKITPPATPEETAPVKAVAVGKAQTHGQIAAKILGRLQRTMRGKDRLSSQAELDQFLATEFSKTDATLKEISQGDKSKSVETLLQEIESVRKELPGGEVKKKNTQTSQIEPLGKKKKKIKQDKPKSVATERTKTGEKKKGPIDLKFDELKSAMVSGRSDAVGRVLRILIPKWKKRGSKFSNQTYQQTIERAIAEFGNPFESDDDQKRSEVRAAGEAAQAEIDRLFRYKEAARSRSVEIHRMNRELLTLFPVYRQARDAEGQEKAAADLLHQIRVYVEKLESIAALVAPDPDSINTSAEQRRYDDLDGIEDTDVLKARSKNLSSQLSKMLPEFIEAHQKKQDDQLDWLSKVAIALLKEKVKTQLKQSGQKILEGKPSETAILTILNGLQTSYARLEQEYAWRWRRAVKRSGVDKFHLIGQFGNESLVWDYGEFRIHRAPSMTKTDEPSVVMTQYRWKAIGLKTYELFPTEIKFDNLDTALRADLHSIVTREEAYAHTLTQLTNLDYIRDLLGLGDRLTSYHREQIENLIAEVEYGQGGVSKSGVRNHLKRRASQNVQAATERLRAGNVSETQGLVQGAIDNLKTRLSELERYQQKVRNRVDYIAHEIRIENTWSVLDHLEALVEKGEDAEAIRVLDELYRRHYRAIASQAIQYRYLKQEVVAIQDNLKRAQSDEAWILDAKNHVANIRKALENKIKRDGPYASLPLFEAAANPKTRTGNDVEQPERSEVRKVAEQAGWIFRRGLENLFLPRAYAEVSATVAEMREAVREVPLEAYLDFLHIKGEDGPYVPVYDLSELTSQATNRLNQLLDPGTHIIVTESAQTNEYQNTLNWNYATPRFKDRIHRSEESIASTIQSLGLGPQVGSVATFTQGVQESFVWDFPGISVRIQADEFRNEGFSKGEIEDLLVYATPLIKVLGTAIREQIPDMLGRLNLVQNARGEVELGIGFLATLSGLLAEHRGELKALASA